ncbi:MAG: hypothetical protein ACOC6I_03670 [Candidatus Bipolaricaulota bacterium]
MNILLAIYNNQIFWTVMLTVYALLITRLTEYPFIWMRSHGVEKNVAVYYDRKIVHMLAGGVVLFAVPFVFTEGTFPFPYAFPLIIGLVLSVATLIPHLTGDLLEWVQVEKNMNEVHFCFMWGVTVFALWIVFGNPWVAIIPPIFMAFGDGITGIVRNALYQKRTKSMVGNVFMLAVTAPAGYFLAGVVGIPFWGLIAAVVASYIERYEFGPIDDNVLITVSASLVLYLGHLIGPIG